MKDALFVTTSILLISSVTQAAELNVSVNGSDANSGTKQAPFRTIQHAADLAQPGDTIMVHNGIYRERVTPPRGGTSDKKRITYQAVSGDKAVITGSELVKNWERVTNDTWKVTISNSFFGKFNPYSDLIHGDWFNAKKRQHHTGTVYLNDDWLTEAAQMEEVLKPTDRTPLWFGVVTNDTATLWSQFKDVNPNEQQVEINVRQTVFTPERPGINYITVRGFDLRDAATPWAPPTAAQIGIVSAFWCKGWIIENNKIRYSACCGVALGKYGDEWDNRAASAEGYVGTVTRALTNGWNKATVGSHIVRNNEISHCEQTGIVGSLGCSFSSITGNDIHDIHVRRLFSGPEQAGIKFHGAIDATISQNHIYQCGTFGLWLDWMGQGAQVSGNLFNENSTDIFLEMQHGPILVANNILASRGQSLHLNSQGIALVHNLIVGSVRNHRGDNRVTPFQQAHATALAGTYPAAKGDSGDHRFYNNLFVTPCSLGVMDDSVLPCFASGNVFTKGTLASKFDADALLETNYDAGAKLVHKSDGWYLTLAEDKAWRNEVKRQLVTTELLGKTKVSNCAYEHRDGSPLKIDTDYLGHPRSRQNPFPGPFESVAGGQTEIKVWPVSMTNK